MGEARVVHAHPERFAPVHHGFAWIRMIGAVAVIYGHCSPLAGTGDLFNENFAVRPDMGVLMGFFTMSGFQITESWHRDPHWLRFAVKRVLRLWPPMLAVSVVMALAVGPLITELSAGQYFSNPGTWQYIIDNAGMLTLIYPLPGVFVHNPWQYAVNGSLWTLPMELIAYSGLFVLLLVGAAKDRRRWLVVAVLVAVGIWDRYLDHIPGPESGGSFLSVPVESMVAFLTAFAIGVVLCVYRVPLSPTAAFAALAALVFMPNSEAASMWMRIAVGYTVVVVAHYWPARLRVPALWVNGSYGVYVWSFPIQQLLAMAGVRNQWLMLACAVPAGYVIGTLSWKYFEEPIMGLRRYIAPVRAKAAEPAEEKPPDAAGEGRESKRPDLQAAEEPSWPSEQPDDAIGRHATPQRQPAPLPSRDGSQRDEEVTRYIPRMPRRYVAEDSPLTRRLANSPEQSAIPRTQRGGGRHAAPEPGAATTPEEQTRPMRPMPRRLDRP